MIDRTPIGDQHIIPGAEPATDATILQRRANAPLRPNRVQLPVILPIAIDLWGPL